MTESHVVIMAGGIGSRFWPMSTEDCPKQFIDILGTGKTLIQMTVERFLPICPASNIWIVTSERYGQTVKAQLPQIPDSNILTEPAARNTAPCIAYACWNIRMHHPDANVVVCPSDALVTDPQEYRRIILRALEFSAQGDRIVTIGVKPSRPETGYGYIETAGGTCSSGEVVKVSSFREKPDAATAQEYLESGRHLWNAGIFVWTAETICKAITRWAPQIAGVMDTMSADFYTPKEKETTARLFPTCEKISIDYAVMEKSPDIYTIPADFGWSDLGTWGSLHANMKRDADDNAVAGVSAELHGCSGCVVHTDSLKRVIIEGLEGYIVAEKDGRLLICRLSEEQKIRDFRKED